ncbi:MAG: hypothetical protein Q4G08_11625, partial [Capnocytophaga sp.]|nr:hypothetical protein [Capnocytophaga sp.]
KILHAELHNTLESITGITAVFSEIKGHKLYFSLFYNSFRAFNEINERLPGGWQISFDETENIATLVYDFTPIDQVETDLARRKAQEQLSWEERHKRNPDDDEFCGFGPSF